MDELNFELVAALPDGSPLGVLTMPAITKTHNSRLRKLWSYGRPAHLRELDGTELDLFAHGFIEHSSEYSFSKAAVVTVTKLGFHHLNEVRQTLIQSQRAHHEIGHRLGAYLRQKGLHTWENIEFCNPAVNQSQARWSVVRPDVFACLPSLKWRNAAPAIYEVKVSRADFYADLAKSEKRGAYAELAEAVYYCCPDGLVSKTEVPAECGLLCEVEPGEFVLRKKAKRNKGYFMATDVAMTLMVKRQVSLNDAAIG